MDKMLFQFTRIGFCDDIHTKQRRAVYNYKTFQIKRSKYATIEKTVSLDTYSLLKETHTRLKITEPKITYDEIIWRLIENDKTIK